MSKRLYGLFFKSPHTGRWIRLYPRLAFTKEVAIRRFQSMLLGLSFRGLTPELRPVKREVPNA